VQLKNNDRTERMADDGPKQGFSANLLLSLSIDEPTPSLQLQKQ
jgi:hypothetical protein